MVRGFLSVACLKCISEHRTEYIGDCETILVLVGSDGYARYSIMV